MSSSDTRSDRNKTDMAGDTARSLLDPSIPRIDSEALFNDGKVVVIVHEGQDYVLRITRNSKLILNK